MTKKEKNGGEKEEGHPEEESESVREGMRKRERPCVSFRKL